MGNCFGFPSKDANPSSRISTNNPPTPGSSSNTYNTTTTMDFSATTSSSAGKSQFSTAVSEAANEEGNNPNGQILEAPNMREFTFADLKSAIKNFKSDTLLGEGGFGEVYEGWIDEKTFVPSKSGTGMIVAIKKLNSESMQGFQEWQLRIAIGPARGLAFLHNSDKKIIYRDFKASIILLDGNYNGMILDFGLAKLGPSGGDSHVTTKVIGTHGCTAPEYIPTGHLNLKSDVYGFGMVLLELMTGLRALDTDEIYIEHKHRIS